MTPDSDRAHALPRPRRPWRSVVRVALIVAAAAVGLVLLAMWFEESLIFFPSRYPDGEWQPPGLAFEDAFFTAADGTALHGWYVPHEDPRAFVLLAHGNAGNLSHRYYLVDELHRLGLSVMIFDYRGYGRSEGSPNEEGILQDARAARAWLAERAGIDEREIVLFGQSLGGGVMVDLAARDGARGLILESTFTSLADVGAYHYPVLPVGRFMRNRLDSLAKIADYHGPLLMLHGDADTIIPYRFGKRLFEAANEPKELVVLEGYDHNDLEPREFYAAIDEFVGRLN